MANYLTGAPYWLDYHDRSYFPDPDEALNDPNGLLAMGGDLSVERLVAAYSQGIFPWYSEDQPILWWSPEPRTVFYPDKINVSRSLKKTIRNKNFVVRFDTDFAQTIQKCAEPRSAQDGTWITHEMIEAYQALHDQGYAHSIETWHEDKLVGGLYGVSLGAMFFGESMFSRMTDASKVALVYLAQQLRAWQFELIDCQIDSPHLSRLGATSLPRKQFLMRLKKNQTIETRLGPWLLELDQHSVLNAYE